MILQPQKTALYDTHVKLGAKMVEFAGFLMPVQYKGILEEHRTVRNSVGIFDVSHMGTFFIAGPKAEDFLQRLTINDVSRLVPNRAQYTGMCYENGGMVDDLILYCFEDRFMAIVNAANRAKDFEWMKKHLTEGVELSDRSDEFSLFAVQGRNAETTLQKVTSVDLSQIKFYWFREGNVAGVPAIIARTGYTGEDGFEIGVNVKYSVEVWNAILQAGAEFGIEPIGLAARDTLRLEMKYCLYGNDIDETTNPIEAGLAWITKIDKGDFVGRQAIQNIKQNGARRKLVGFQLKDRAFPRHGYKIFKDSLEVGYVTSGTFSPSLEKGIGIGYINAPYHEIGMAISIEIRQKRVPAEVVKTPFYLRPY
ncbi:MAG: glycine cleavage system aminomethyltransferase GcvT [bacterium]